MKKALVIIAAVMCMAVTASAQSKALGVRLGYGGEVSYQHYMGGDNFLEADLGWFSNGFYVSGIYDFVLASEGNFNFYAGPGAQLGATTGEEGEFAIGICGQLGMEYNFNVPIQLSLDWRPGFNFIGGAFGWQSFALGIRYRF